MPRAAVATGGPASGKTGTRAATAVDKAGNVFFRVSEKRIARLMREDGLRARAGKRFRSTTMSEHDQPVAANVLAPFRPEPPNQRWGGDTTEFVIGSSAKLYLATILDRYSRFIVGWALSAVNDRHLALKALECSCDHIEGGGRERLEFVGGDDVLLRWAVRCSFATIGTRQPGGRTNRDRKLPRSLNS